MFSTIEPEVAGGLGPDSKLDTTVHPPIVFYLNYEFYGWLGDDILQTFPCFIVTERLKQAIEDGNLTGIDFAYVKITLNDEFKELQPDTVLPPFHWMKISGSAGKDDFGIAKDYRLVVSEKALSLIKTFNARDLLEEDYNP